MEYLATLDKVASLLSIVTFLLHLAVSSAGVALHRKIFNNKISPLWAASALIPFMQPIVFAKTMKTVKTIFGKKKLTPIIDFGGCYLTFWFASIGIAAFIAIRFITLTTFAESEMAILAYGLTASLVLNALSFGIGLVVLYDSKKQISQYLAIRKQRKSSQEARRG